MLALLLILKKPNSSEKSVDIKRFTDLEVDHVGDIRRQGEGFDFTGTNSELSMWMFYNLITGANKNSYLDSFLGRSVNATEISVGMTEALNHRDEAYSWFIE